MLNIKEIFYEKTFDGIHQSPLWHFHRYCINCKLSGSVYAISEIEGAISLIHGVRSCAFHQRLTPRKMYDVIYNMPCTDLDENDVIHGGEEKLKKKIYEVYEKYKPDLIAILPTCIPGLIGDDIEGVVNEVDVPCDLIYVPSDGFAHRSRESLDKLMRDYAKAWKNPEKVPAYDLRGCGYEEVMFAIVEQLMEEQDIEENLINIETSGRYTYGFKSEIAEVKRIFGRMGVKVNLALPTCTVKELKKAPAAELNIVTRNIRWAQKMKKKFGNDYFRKWFYYYGFDGLEKFYNEVAERLGVDDNGVIKEEKERALEELKKYQDIYCKYNYAVCVNAFFFTPYLIKIYANDVKFPIRYLIIDTRMLRSHNISEETAKIMLNNIEDVIEKEGYDFEVVIDPTYNEMRNIAEEVDFLVSDRVLPLKYLDVSGVRALLFRTSFYGIVEFGRYIAEKIQKRRFSSKANKKLIISKFDYDERYYPMLNDERCQNAREMWATMWGLKGE